jgi:hypothetical protein
MARDTDAKSDLDEKNKEAEHVNPSRTGVRSGNPQLDPDAARREEGKTTKDRPQSPPAHGRG